MSAVPNDGAGTGGEAGGGLTDSSGVVERRDSRDPKVDPFGWVGTTIAEKYAVESVVGEGGFGVVYRARHAGFAEAVAIKCLKLPSTFQGEVREAFLKNFLAEGRLLHQVSRATADVVQALDVGEATSPTGVWTPYIVLEWLDGVPLSQDLRHRARQALGGRPLDEAVALLEPAARGLAAAHAQGVAHRDVKPANLILAEVSGRPTLKVVDFGIAKGDAATHEGALGGGEAVQADSMPEGMPVAFTPRYGAPEQFSQRYGPTGTWTDVFALALVLVEVVTGESALEGDEPGKFYLQASDLMNRPTLRARGVSVSDDVEMVLLRALAVDPKRRYASAGEFWDALVRAMPESQNRPQSIQPKSNVTGKVAIPAIALGASSDEAGEMVRPSLAPAHRRREALALAGVAVAVLLSVGACAFLWLAAKSDQSPPVNAATSAAHAAEPAPSPPAPPGMIYVRAGAFSMGGDTPADQPVHRVVLTQPFFIDATEVTAADFASCVHEGGCTPARAKSESGARDPGTGGCLTGAEFGMARHPANCVDREQSVAFCTFVGKRLPTEAEWEYAARGGDGRAYPWGPEPPTTCWMAVVAGVSGACGRKGAWAVGSTADGRSAFGAFDMAGNVREWVADGWETYPRSDVVDPLVPASGARGVVRGGSWDDPPASAKATSRAPFTRSWANAMTGFRCAKGL